LEKVVCRHLDDVKEFSTGVSTELTNDTTEQVMSFSEAELIAQKAVMADDGDKPLADEQGEIRDDSDQVPKRIQSEHVVAEPRRLSRIRTACRRCIEEI